MEHTTIAVDLARSVFQVSVFQVAVSHRARHVDEKRRLSRTTAARSENPTFSRLTLVAA
jgi:hypothetical protein